MVARLETTPRGFDARYVVTSLRGELRHLYEGVYCARGQAENLIKQHKVQLASDRTSCQSPLANQFRLVTGDRSRLSAAFVPAARSVSLPVGTLPGPRPEYPITFPASAVASPALSGL